MGGDYIPGKVCILMGKDEKRKRKETIFIRCASSFACYLIIPILCKLRLSEIRYLSTMPSR